MRKALGLIFILLGVAALAFDLWRWGTGDGQGPLLAAVGDWWFRLAPDSLQLLQPAVERHLSPALWDPWIQSILLAPAVLVCLIIGTVLILLSRLHRPWRNVA